MNDAERSEWDNRVKEVVARVDAEIAKMSPEELERAGEEAVNDQKFHEFIRKYSSEWRKEYLRKNRCKMLWWDIKYGNWKLAIWHIKEIYF